MHSMKVKVTVIPISGVKSMLTILKWKEHVQVVNKQG